jgi:hypothetical protein
MSRQGKDRWNKNQAVAEKRFESRLERDRRKAAKKDKQAEHEGEQKSKS